MERFTVSRRSAPRSRPPSTVGYGRPGLGLLLLGSLVLAAGCGSQRALLDRPLDEGRALLFEAPASEVLSAARSAVREAGLRIELERRETDRAWTLLGRQFLTDGSLAADVRVVVEEVQEGRTEVRVLTRRHVPTEIRAGDPYADAIFSYLTGRFLRPP